ncbi:hypothetical protein ADL15_17960 [Actinoplanes awajinensis subsp. mycoplanecinus]|uniref:AAA+ ATPase domain-containing protein n=2 Tax=Actinoplanes awajinensis TaxID=135946 RepID=A0A101JUN3_9ACTN|nr:hypothetical protein ADL15_17960 [Actinoplanes awajinensis subsp. mycoplanecinus]
MMDGMARLLGYLDAVRLLGGQDSKLVSAVEKIVGGALLVATPAAPVLLGLFDAKGELVRLSHELVRTLSERRSGLSRASRTERLEAAHAVLVVTAFFEAMEQARLPFRFGDLELTKTEQSSLADRAIPATVDQAPMMLPSPLIAPETYLLSLTAYYGSLAGSITTFTAGLAVWERLTVGRRKTFYDAMSAVPARAVLRYEELFRQLAGEFPEVACWASQREHRATRTALAGLEETLTAISTGRAPDQRRASLALAYRAELGRRIVESGDVPDGIRVPELGEGYVPPRFRAVAVRANDQVSEESWWDARPVRDDLPEFLLGHLTSPQAVRAPLLVLGQPGSGKSVLTRVLAARLPAADFLPIRVILRDVPTLDDVQDQIEHAIREATGERVEWPALARSAGDAMPVVLLDGFDELLQAVGVSHTDYLTRVARFQRREADQGRPVAVIVTSRTAVADRARTPEETVALRLEPFDDERVIAWLDIWNRVNAANFAARHLKPLAAETVLAHRDLAGQPLLLLMLALYDADGNVLQRSGPHLRADELYEQLLRSFALREITKHREGLPDRELAAAVENELRRLSVVAFAMFNRAAQWVTESDLERDIAALQITGPVGPGAASGLRAPLPEAELTLGRFFFIHRARSAGDETRFQTYEFLHATFGEYLVARLSWQVLQDLAVRDAAASASFHPGPAEDELLRALLSFQPLSVRAPVIDFLAHLAAATDDRERERLRALLVRLFRAINHAPPAARYPAYQPQSPSVPARYATYAANLLLLMLCLGDVRGSELYPEPPDPVDAWHAQALLWRSQLSTDAWTSVVEMVSLERTWEGDRRDLRLSLYSASVAPALDLGWTFDVRPAGAFTLPDLHPEQLRLKSYFQCSVLDDMVHHALEPLVTHLPLTVSTVAGDGAHSAAHLLLRILADSAPSADDFRRASEILDEVRSWDDTTRSNYTRLLLDRLRRDDATPQATAIEIRDLVERLLRRE